jgi:hypothetical protein
VNERILRSPVVSAIGVVASFGLLFQSGKSTATHIFCRSCRAL